MKTNILKISFVLSILILAMPTFAKTAPKAESKPAANAAEQTTEKAAEKPAFKALKLLEEGGVEFQALGRPAMLKIVGKAPAPKGDFSLDKGGNLSGKFKVAIDSLDTGIKLRNEHMRDKYLEVAKHPEAEFTLNPISLPELAKADDFSREGVAYTGTMKLHGVEKPVSGQAKVERKGGKLSVSANMSLKTSDYAIETPKYLGITVAEEVKVAVSLAAKE